MEKNLYEILEIKKSETLPGIKNAYAKMLRKYPPEKFSEEFSKIHEAYEILTDREKRMEYDEFNGYSKNSQVMLDEGLKLIEEGKRKEGRDRLHSFINLEGPVKSVLHELAKSYSEDKDYERAYAIQKKVVDESSNLKFEYMEWLLFYLYKLGDTNVFNQYMKKTILKFDSPWTYFNLSTWYIDDGKIKEAKSILQEKVVPYIEKRPSVENYSKLARLLFEVDLDRKGAEVLVRAILIETNREEDILEKLEDIKTVIIEKLKFENANEMAIVLEELLKYVNSTREALNNYDFKNNLGWTSIAVNLVKDLAFIEGNDFHSQLKEFLIASVKKRISIDENIMEESDKELLELLEQLKLAANVEKIKSNLLILEKFHEDIYKLDAKYLFDKFGGFIPYEGIARNKKVKKEVKPKKTKRQKAKEKELKKEENIEKRKSSIGSKLIAIGVIIIIIAILQFI